MIALDYNYGDLLGLLTDRGTALKDKDQNQSEQKKIDIDNYTQTNYETLIRPKNVFITFQKSITTRAIIEEQIKRR